MAIYTITGTPRTLKDQLKAIEKAERASSHRYSKAFDEAIRKAEHNLYIILRVLERNALHGTKDRDIPPALAKELASDDKVTGVVTGPDDEILAIRIHWKGQARPEWNFYGEGSFKGELACYVEEFPDSIRDSVETKLDELVDRA